MEGHEAAFRYRDDSLISLLQKAMARKATFITKDSVIDWIELKKNEPKYTDAEALKGREGRYQSHACMSVYGRS